MPSLGDVANELKSILQNVEANTGVIKNDTAVIKSDTATIKNNTNTIVNQINVLDTDVKTGFSNLAQGLQILIQLGLQANALSEENNAQNRTIICWLSNIANTLCDIKHDSDKQVRLQTDIATTLHHVDDMAELVHAREALEVAKRQELEKKVEKCCPPPIEPLRPCFEPCVAPNPIRFDPVKFDWKPVIFTNPNKPPG